MGRNGSGLTNKMRAVFKEKFPSQSKKYAIQHCTNCSSESPCKSCYDGRKEGICVECRAPFIFFPESPFWKDNPTKHKFLFLCANCLSKPKAICQKCKDPTKIDPLICDNECGFRGLLCLECAKIPEIPPEGVKWFCPQCTNMMASARLNKREREYVDDDPEMAVCKQMSVALYRNHVKKRDLLKARANVNDLVAKHDQAVSKASAANVQKSVLRESALSLLNPIWKTGEDARLQREKCLQDLLMANNLQLELETTLEPLVVNSGEQLALAQQEVLRLHQERDEYRNIIKQLAGSAHEIFKSGD